VFGSATAPREQRGAEKSEGHEPDGSCPSAPPAGDGCDGRASPTNNRLRRSRPGVGGSAAGAQVRSRVTPDAPATGTTVSGLTATIKPGKIAKRAFRPSWMGLDLTACLIACRLPRRSLRGLPGSPGRFGQQPAYERDDGWWSSLPVRLAGPGRPSVEMLFMGELHTPAGQRPVVHAARRANLAVGPGLSVQRRAGTTLRGAIPRHDHGRPVRSLRRSTDLRIPNLHRGDDTPPGDGRRWPPRGQGR